jgi:hypothetical protein
VSSAKGSVGGTIGRTPQRVTFVGHPIEAAAVRTWTAEHTAHPDAPLVASELFVAVMRSGARTVELVLIAAGDRLRITAIGPESLPLANSHGPGWNIVAGLSRLTGVTADEHGLWAQLVGAKA